MENQFSTSAFPQPWLRAADDPRRIPLTLRREHADIRAGLARAASEPGPVGHAATSLARTCLHHFELEEQTVLPVFAVLHELVSGDVREEMAGILPLIDEFRREHDCLNRQHQSILSAIEALWEAAYEEDNRRVSDLAYRIRSHERMEDGVVYPTVLLIGRYVRGQIPLLKAAS